MGVKHTGYALILRLDRETEFKIKYISLARQTTISKPIIKAIGDVIQKYEGEHGVISLPEAWE